MDLPDPKALQKLAAACRKAGITTFKGAGIEFTLAPILPATLKAQKAATASQMPINTDPDVVETSEPTANELMFWSSGAPQEDEGQSQ